MSHEKSQGMVDAVLEGQAESPLRILHVYVRRKVSGYMEEVSWKRTGLREEASLCISKRNKKV